MTDIQEKKELKDKISRRRGTLAWGIQVTIWGLVCWGGILTGEIDRLEWLVILLAAILTSIGPALIAAACFEQVD